MDANRVSVFLLAAIAILTCLIIWFHFRLENTNQKLEQIFDKLDELQHRIKEARANVCNYSLATVFATAAVRVSKRRMRLTDVVAIETGDCNVFSSYHYPGSGQVYVYGSTQVDAAWLWVNEKVNESALSNGAEPLNAGLGETVHYHGTNDFSFCATRHQRKHDRAPASDESCEEAEILVGFALAGFDSNAGTWFHAFEQPNWPVFPGLQYDAKSQEVARKRVLDLRENAVNQSAAERELISEHALAYLGAELDDFNTPLNPGIRAKTVLSTDIYGESQKLAAGDIIYTVNGNSVFGLPDFFRELQAHARDVNRGIAHPLTLGVVSANCPGECRIPARYFFNTQNWAEATQGDAAMWGFANTALFGQFPWVKCYAQDAGVATMNIFRFLWELIASLFMKREPDMDSVEFDSFKTPEERKRCIWQNEQSEAIARQVQAKYFESAQLLGIVAPGGFRLIFGKAITRGVATRVGAGAAARATSGAITESVESVLWSFAAAPPGMSFEERLKKAQSDLPMAIGIGFATGTLLDANAMRR